MCRMIKFVVRWGLILGVLIVGLGLLLGPDRMAAAVGVVRQHAIELVDQHLDDPAAMRVHLSRLAERYPEQIVEVRGELAAIQCQVEQFEQDTDVARRVVALTGQDLRELAVAVQHQQPGGLTPVNFVLKGRHFDLEEAHEEGRRVRSIRDSYQDRILSNVHHLELLKQQEERLSEILSRLETEYTQYSDQLWTMDRQIDMIERNGRLIEITESQQATLRNFDRFGRMSNLDQIESKLAEIRAVQEGTLQALSGRGMHDDYEARARRQDGGDLGGDLDNPFAGVLSQSDPAAAF